MKIYELKQNFDGIYTILYEYDKDKDNKTYFINFYIWRHVNYEENINQDIEIQKHYKEKDSADKSGFIKWDGCMDLNSAHFCYQRQLFILFDVYIDSEQIFKKINGYCEFSDEILK